VALWWIVVWLGALIALSLRHPGAHRATGGRPDLREIGRLVMNPVFAIFMAASACIQASHAVIYALGSLHWRALGIGETEIGALWAAGVAVEILFMTVFGTYAIERLGAVRAMAVAALAAVLRWGAMMGDPTGAWLWGLQTLHALTFGMAHLGMIAFISRAVPDRNAGTAQGATGAMAVGGVMAVQMAVAAALYPALGGATYGIGAASAALGLGFCLWLARRWRGEELAV
jgi:PPP family 3-phenylpropionic acid transporter